MGLEWVYDDGGRAAAGYVTRRTGAKAPIGDCVVRAIAIASGQPYQEVYDDIGDRSKLVLRKRQGRNGVSPKVYRPWFTDYGWGWFATMGIGTGCTNHLVAGEVPMLGSHVVRLSGHLVAVVDGVIHDTHNPSRGGTRCVYGWWTNPLDEDRWLNTPLAAET